MFDRLRSLLWRRLVLAGMRGAMRTGNDFLTFHARPKRADGFGTRRDPGMETGPVAIVMQGPIATDSDFTLETLRLYKKHFGDCHLILSTWVGTPEAELGAIRELGVDIVLSQKPPVPGPSNVNMQIVSASTGVKHAVSKGARWIVKTRTDQRLCDPNVLGFLVATATAFPVATGVNQKYRIIGIGHGTLKFALYHFTDQTVFGHADDMLRYWTPPLREAHLPEYWPQSYGEVLQSVSIEELSHHASPETYFASRFVISGGRSLAWTLEDTWTVFRDHFCVVDYAATDFYWLKQHQQTLRELPVDYSRMSNRRELSYREWLLLYSGLLPTRVASEYEIALAQPFDWPRPDIAFQSLWRRPAAGKSEASTVV